MPIWSKTGQLPKSLSREQKREVVATDAGFVRRIKYTDIHSNVRVKDEILVAIEGLANNTNFGAPSITDIWFSRNTAPINTPITINIAFDEPIFYANTTVGSVRLAVANTVAGAAGVAVSNTTIFGADNTLRFTFTPTVAGTYAVQTQTMANATATAITSLKSRNSGNEAITLTISAPQGAVANTLIVT